MSEPVISCYLGRSRTGRHSRDGQFRQTPRLVVRWGGTIAENALKKGGARALRFSDDDSDDDETTQTLSLTKNAQNHTYTLRHQSFLKREIL